MRKDMLVTILGTVALALALAAPASATDSTLLAAWPFDAATQTVVDVSGNGNHGHLGASPTPDDHDPIFIDGFLGAGALAFAGNSYVQVPDTGRLELARLTVAAWVRRLGSPGKWRYILSKGALSCERSAYGLYSAANGGMAFYVSDRFRYFRSPVAPPPSVWDGRWHHVAGSFDGEAVRLYVDGIEVGTGSPAPIAIAYGTGSKGIYIGAYRGSCELPFRGDIDDVRVWGVARGPAQIATDAAQIASGDGTGPLAVSDGGAATGPSKVTGSANAQPRACYVVRLSRRTVVVGHRAKLVATVRDRGRPVSGARLRIDGGGTQAFAVTSRNGRARVVVRAKRRSKLLVSVIGQRSWCPKPTITARLR